MINFTQNSTGPPSCRYTACFYWCLQRNVTATMTYIFAAYVSNSLENASQPQQQ